MAHSLVGTEIEPVTERITPEIVQRYVEATGIADPTPYTIGVAPWGPIVPVTLLENLGLCARGNRLRTNTSRGTVHAKQETVLLRPLVVGKAVTIRGRVVEQYWKRGKEWTVVEETFTDEDGHEIALMRSTNVALT